LSQAVRDESARRVLANQAWLENAFKMAAKEGARGVVIFTQAAINFADDRGVTTDRWRRAEALFHEMLARPAAERAAALAAECPDDPRLQAAVQALLDRPRAPFETPATWAPGP
jgi:hypothetical protein